MNKVAPKPPLGQKVGNFVSPKWRKSANGKRCTLRLEGCTGEAAGLAHLRYFAWAGIGEKPDDFLGVYACQNCHDIQENRKSGVWTFEDLLRALGETLKEHYKDGRIK